MTCFTDCYHDILYTPARAKRGRACRRTRKSVKHVVITICKGCHGTLHLQACRTKTNFESGFSRCPQTNPAAEAAPPKPLSVSLKHALIRIFFQTAPLRKKGRDPKISPATFCSRQPLVGSLDDRPSDRDLLRTARRAIRDDQSPGVHSQVASQEADEDFAAPARSQVGQA
jgi:hypothetical protein